MDYITPISIVWMICSLVGLVLLFVLLVSIYWSRTKVVDGWITLQIFLCFVLCIYTASFSVIRLSRRQHLYKDQYTSCLVSGLVLSGFSFLRQTDILLELHNIKKSNRRIVITVSFLVLTTLSMLMLFYDLYLVNDQPQPDMQNLSKVCCIILAILVFIGGSVGFLTCQKSSTSVHPGKQHASNTHNDHKGIEINKTESVCLSSECEVIEDQRNQTVDGSYAEMTKVESFHPTCSSCSISVSSSNFSIVAKRVSIAFMNKSDEESENMFMRPRSWSSSVVGSSRKTLTRQWSSSVIGTFHNTKDDVTGRGGRFENIDGKQKWCSSIDTRKTGRCQNKITSDSSCSTVHISDQKSSESDGRPNNPTKSKDSFVQQRTFNPIRRISSEIRSVSFCSSELSSRSSQSRKNQSILRKNIISFFNPEVSNLNDNSTIAPRSQRVMPGVLSCIRKSSSEMKSPTLSFTNIEFEINSTSSPYSESMQIPKAVVCDKAEFVEPNHVDMIAEQNSTEVNVREWKKATNKRPPFLLKKLSNIKSAKSDIYEVRDPQISEKSYIQKTPEQVHTDSNKEISTRFTTRKDVTDDTIKPVAEMGDPEKMSHSLERVEFPSIMFWLIFSNISAMAILLSLIVSNIIIESVNKAVCTESSFGILIITPFLLIFLLNYKYKETRQMWSCKTRVGTRAVIEI